MVGEAKEKLVVVGARGHARAVADVVHAAGGYEIVGLIDSFQSPGTLCLGYAVLGGEADLPALCQFLQVQTLFVAIGDNFQRAAMTTRIREQMPQARFATLVHPSAVVGREVQIGAGTVIMPGAVVVGGSTIGAGCILNTASSLDHDGVMEDWSSLGPGVAAGGHLRLGKRSFLGLGAKVINGISIGQDSVIGAGSLVLDDVPGDVVAYGSPCRRVRTRMSDERYL